MAIGNSHDDFAPLRTYRGDWEREAWGRERWDSDASDAAGPESSLPSCEEAVTELLTTTAGVVFLFIVIIVLVNVFG